MTRYVIHVFSGHELQTAELLRVRLEQAGMRATLDVPTEKFALKKGIVDKPQFTGYVFIETDEMTDAMFYVIKGTTGVVKLLTQPVTEIETAIVEKRTEISETAPITSIPVWNVNDLVTVKAGSFAGFSGKVEKVHGDSIVVGMELLGRITPVTVSALDVMKGAA
jgi:transcription antitermination factor NusG